MFGSFTNQIAFAFPCASPEDDVHGISKLSLKKNKQKHVTLVVYCKLRVYNDDNKFLIISLYYENIFITQLMTQRIHSNLCTRVMQNTEYTK